MLVSSWVGVGVGAPEDFKLTDFPDKLSFPDELVMP